MAQDSAPERNNKLDAALDAAKKGYRIFPAHNPIFRDSGTVACSCSRPKCKEVGKHPRISGWQHSATTDESKIREWWRKHPDANIATPTGDGLVVLDEDTEDAAAEAKRRGYREGPVVRTGRGRQRHFRPRDGAEYRNSAGDLHPGLDVRGEGGLVILPGSTHHSGKSYEWEFEGELPEAPEWLAQKKGPTLKHKTFDTARVLEGFDEGKRNSGIASLAGKLRHADVPKDAAAELVLKAGRNSRPPLDDDEVLRVLDSVYRYPAGANSEPQTWPEIDASAFHGLAGNIAHAIDPHTEADIVAVLVNILVACGSAVGRGCFIRAGARHHLNLFAGIVGDTSKGRKGTSWEYVNELMQEADPDWAKNRVKSGLSSGEGLINAVRDPIWAPGKDGEPIVVDKGVEDKRLLAMEGEFAQVLQVMARSGNTVSPNIRNAWDGKKLETLVRHSPLQATSSHVSIIGHITKTELLRLLTDTESANGFANRFLWLMSRRSKQLPFGGTFYTVNTDPLVQDLRDAIEFGETADEIGWGESAKPIWRDVYAELSEGKPGLLGAVTSRAEAQVVRLAALYAALDHSKSIENDHLVAALALWRYAEDSAKYIFGDTVGDPIADQILTALRNNPEGLTRTEIYNVVGKRKKAAQLDRALSLLLELGKARSITEATDGRSTERWMTWEA